MEAVKTLTPCVPLSASERGSFESGGYPQSPSVNLGSLPLPD